MRFNKGRKVEVLSKKEVPSGAWRCAEIISGSGNNYSVKYDCPLGTTSEGIVESVLRKEIRPCPPPVQGVERWVAGDMVEVFADLSWKIATVLKAIAGGYYLVRLLGSSREFWVLKSDIRVRQSWQDNKWIVIGTGSGTCEGVKYNKRSTLGFYQKNHVPVPRAYAKRKLQREDDCLADQINPGFQGSHIVSTRTLKRALPYCTSHVETNTGNFQKMKAIEKEGGFQRVMSGYPSRLLEKVDAVAYPENNMGETHMHTSFNNQTTRYYQMETGKPNGFDECFLSRSSRLNDSDRDTCSIASSVGSCSVISNSPNKLSSRILAGPYQDADILCSDAESFYGCGDEEQNCPLPLEEQDVAARIHRLELHAYRSTMEALYAFGPLSWEHEALLTNLRISLNISNDEHLMGLRNLISDGINLCIS